MGKASSKPTMMRFEPKSGWSEADTAPTAEVVSITDHPRMEARIEPRVEPLEDDAYSAEALVALGESIQDVFDSLQINDPRLQAWTQVHAAIKLIGTKLQEKKALEDRIVALGKDPAPDRVRFTTWTLRYNQSHWVRLDGLEEHWSRARVDATVDLSENMVRVKTANVAALSLLFPAGSCQLVQGSAPRVMLDSQKLEAPFVETDKSWTVHFRKLAGKWSLAAFPEDAALRKRHGLQGPIDDAFLDSFLMVRPTGTPLNERVGKWADAEMKHAIEHWRRQYRGDARVKDDITITDADIAQHNLVLWGDPASNKFLARVLDRLPVRWDAQSVRVGALNYSSAEHVPVLIYPNPLNPKKYIVLNSGFTFREYDYLNNARQVPKLPDYAIIDLNIPVSSRLPGGIATAGFFGERWELLPGGTK